MLLRRQTAEGKGAYNTVEQGGSEDGGKYPGRYVSGQPAEINANSSRTPPHAHRLGPVGPAVGTRRLGDRYLASAVTPPGLAPATSRAHTGTLGQHGPTVVTPCAGLNLARRAVVRMLVGRLGLHSPAPTFRLGLL